MIIVSGKLIIAEGQRQEFLASSYKAVRQARSTTGCRDFVVAADPLEENRVNVYEEWETESQLEQFRADGPDEDLSNMIISFSVKQREIEE